MTEENKEVSLASSEDQNIAEESIEETTSAMASLKPTASKSEMLFKGNETFCWHVQAGSFCVS